MTAAFFAGGSNKFKINKTTGKVTVRKSTIKGKYIIRIRIKAAATSKYKAASKTIRSTIIVK